MSRPSRHPCHAIGCDKAIPAGKLMCHRHWYLVPLELRHAVLVAYRPGQEVAKNPARDYLVAATAAVLDVAVKERHITPQEAEERLALLEALV